MQEPMPTKRNRGRRRNAATWLVLLLTGFYFFFAGQVSPAEALACLPAIFAATWLASRWHDVTDQPFNLHVPWPRILLRLSCALGVDSFRVMCALLVALWRRPVREIGHVETQPFTPGGSGRADATRRALVTLGASLAPNGVVIDVLPEKHSLVLHRLVPAPPVPDIIWPL
jgi:hypothetical protein